MATLLFVVLAPASWAANQAHPWQLQGGTSASGYPLGGSGPAGTQIKFIARGSFWLGVILHNSSKQSLTITAATTSEPRSSLAHQSGFAFAPFTPCTGDRLCVPSFAEPGHPPLTRPLVVKPGHDVAVKLEYRLVSCAQAAAATTASSDTLIIAYRAGSGAVEHQLFSLRGSKLLLQRPVGEACLPRPYSYIGLVGSFTTSPQHKPMPGSNGDTCTLSASNGLAFTSRQFFDRSQTLFAVRIQLPQYHGLGTYSVASAKDRVLGPAVITVTGAFGLTSQTVFVDRSGLVTVTKAEPPIYGGRFEAVLSGHRRFFRAYGSWRCTTKLK